MSKYELLDKEVNGLYRIRALKDFKNVEEGDLGGYVKSEDNLSQSDSCWIYDNAKVIGNARVFENAKVSDSAVISGNAQIFGNAQVRDYARIQCNAKVYQNAIVDNSAIITGDASIYGFSWIRGNAYVGGAAKIFGCARVYGNAKVQCESQIYGHAALRGYSLIFGKAKVFGYSLVTGNAIVRGNAKIGGYIHLITGVTTDKKITTLLKNSCYAAAAGGKVVLYKRVNKIKKGVYASTYDDTFQYRDGEVAEVDNCDKSSKSCTSGLHCSYPGYWDMGDTLIAVEVNIKDIITVQEGKARCKRLKVIGECK